MLRVRRSLTEILLEVTNNEISAVCTEVWKRYRSKGTFRFVNDFILGQSWM